MKMFAKKTQLIALKPNAKSKINTKGLNEGKIIVTTIPKSWSIKKKIETLLNFQFTTNCVIEKLMFFLISVVLL